MFQTLIQLDHAAYSPETRISELQERVYTGTFKNHTTGMVAKGVPQQVCILHRLDLLEEQYADKTNSLLTQIEEISEKLTQCMLNQFHINGAQPLLESRVQDMITNANITLRDILLAEIRLVRGTANVSEQCTSQVSATETWPTGTLVDGHMQWSWGGRIHMVPKGWSLPKGNVSMLFNLWVKGNSALHLQPYCFLKGWDFQATEEKTGVNLPMVLSAAARKKALDTTPATWRSYLSQATDVMIVIEDECGMTFQRLAALSAQDREAKFISAFQALCRKLHPGLSDEQLDAKRLHEN
eukprot:431838-Rhodomonas_salina.1